VGLCNLSTGRAARKPRPPEQGRHGHAQSHHAFVIGQLIEQASQAWSCWRDSAHDILIRLSALFMADRAPTG
jgi:hypothetical protein